MKFKCVDFSVAANRGATCDLCGLPVPLSRRFLASLNIFVQWVCAQDDVRANCGTGSAWVHVKVQRCMPEGYPVQLNAAVADCAEIFSKTPLLIWTLSLNWSSPVSSLRAVFWVFWCSFISSSPGRYCPGQYQERPNNTCTLSVSMPRSCLQWQRKKIHILTTSEQPHEYLGPFRWLSKRREGSRRVLLRPFTKNQPVYIWKFEESEWVSEWVSARGTGSMTETNRLC